MQGVGNKNHASFCDQDEQEKRLLFEDPQNTGLCKAVKAKKTRFLTQKRAVKKSSPGFIPPGEISEKEAFHRTG